MLGWESPITAWIWLGGAWKRVYGWVEFWLLFGYTVPTVLYTACTRHVCVAVGGARVSLFHACVAQRPDAWPVTGHGTI